MTLAIMMSQLVLRPVCHMLPVIPRQIPVGRPVWCLVIQHVQSNPTKQCKHLCLCHSMSLIILSNTSLHILMLKSRAILSLVPDTDAGLKGWKCHPACLLCSERVGLLEERWELCPGIVVGRPGGMTETLPESNESDSEMVPSPDFMEPFVGQLHTKATLSRLGSQTVVLIRLDTKNPMLSRVSMLADKDTFKSVRLSAA